MEHYMIRAGFIAGATAGVALGILQWAAYLVGILPYQVYILTAGTVLPPTLAFTVYGYLLGFLGHTVFSGLLGILFAYILHHRSDTELLRQVHFSNYIHFRVNGHWLVFH